MQFLYFLRPKIKSADPGQKKGSIFSREIFLIFTFLLLVFQFSIFSTSRLCPYSQFSPFFPISPYFPPTPLTPIPLSHYSPISLSPFFLTSLSPYFYYLSFKIYTIYIPEKRSLKITRDLWVVDSATGGLYGPFFWPYTVCKPLPLL